MNENKPLMKRRDVLNDIKTRCSSPPWDKSGKCLIIDPDGVRRTGGMNLIRALVRNVGTYIEVLEGKVRAEELRRMKVLKLRSRGRVIRSSDEVWETKWSEGVTSYGFRHHTNCVQEECDV